MVMFKAGSILLRHHGGPIVAKTHINQTSKKLILLAAAMAVLAIFAAACGSDGDSASETTAQATPSPQAPASDASDSTTQTVAEQTQAAASPATQQTAQPDAGTTAATDDPVLPSAAPIDSDLPDVAVQRVSTGEELVLSSLAPASRPLLLWFWAPH